MKFCKTRLLPLVAVLAVFVMQAAAQGMPEVKMDTAIHYGKLPNGMTYYIRHNSQPRERANFYIAQKVGSIQEDDSQRGLAHFLEHMCFNGSEHFPGSGILRYCESIGVKYGRNLNAYTSTDETVYNIDDVPVTDSNIDSCLLILHDWSCGLTLDSAEIEKERGVIHEEWRWRSSGMMRIVERQLPALYPGSKYGNRLPIGLMSVVDSFKPATLRKYYETWYRPDLQALVIVGDFDAAKVEAKVKAMFSDIKMPSGNVAKFEKYPVPDTYKPIYLSDKDKELTSPVISVMFKQDVIPDSLRNTPVFFAQAYVTIIATSCLNSRLTELSRKEGCTFDGASSDYSNYMISNTKDALNIGIEPKKGKGTEALTSVMEEVLRAAKFGFTDSEIARAKADFFSGLDRIYQNRNKQKNNFYVSQYVRNFIEGEPIPSIEDEMTIDKLVAANIKPADISAAFARIVSSLDTNFVCCAFYPDKEGVSVPSPDELRDAVSAAAKADLKPYVDDVKLEPLVSKLPAKGKVVKETPADFGYTRLQLSNGTNIYYKETDFNDSQILMSARSHGGYQKLKNADAANVKIFDDVINSTGLGDFTATQLEKKLAGCQATTGVSLGETEEQIYGSTTPGDLRKLFEMLYLRFCEPANDTDGYNNTISVLKTQLENASKNPIVTFQDSVTSALYGNDPYKRRVSMDDLSKADYSKIRAIYRDRFASPADFNFFFTGNLNPDSLKAFAEEYIASLPGCKKEPVTKKFTPVSGKAKTVSFTRQMETPKAYIFVFYTAPDTYTLRKDITAEIGGELLKKIYTRTIREQASIAYTVQADGEYRIYPDQRYVEEIICPAKPAKVDSAMLLVKQGIDDVATKGVAAENLADIVKFNVKDYNDKQRNNGYWASLITFKVMYGVDLHTGYLTTLQSITSADIQKFFNDALLKHGPIIVKMLPESLNETQGK